MSNQKLSYLYGQPKSAGQLRSEYADFKVFELLPFAPSGEGEHLFIHVRKTGTNTVYVARQLAKYFGVKDALVGYAGLKDRFAVTEQWFGVHVPGKTVYDLSDCNIDGVEILSYKRHNKKLKTGALLGNRFELVLRNVTDVDDIKTRWDNVAQGGVPNYFGEQRFGFEGGNIERAKSLFSGTKVKDKKKRSIYLSAARSLLFNDIVNRRVENGCFNVIQSGDVCMLAGTQSVFVVDQVDDTLTKRHKEKDIDLTAPMWGAGELMTQGEVQDIEFGLKEEYPDLCAGLAKFGLKQERRRMRLSIEQSNLEVVPEGIKISFVLPAGAYATTVLREILNYKDVSERHPD